jgi:hypothetical protein
MEFTRTPGGLIEKWRFHDVPTIWIEGSTDLFFYQPAANGIPCRFEPFCGAKNSDALLDALLQHDYPYLVILDGDYSILGRRRSPHPHALILSRYSYENYLWEPEAINSACLRHACCGDNKDLVITKMHSAQTMLEDLLLPVLILDVAAREMETSPKVLPDRIDCLLVGKKSANLEPERLEEILCQSNQLVDATMVRVADEKVSGFLQKRPVTHLIQGHLLFGLLRRIFIESANRERGSSASAGDQALLQIFSDAVWLRCKSGDHAQLKRKLRSSLRNVSEKFSRTQDFSLDDELGPSTTT